MFVVSEELNSYISILHNNVLNSLKTQIQSVQPFFNKKLSPLEMALLKGKVKYTGFYFEGYFTDLVSEELKSIGAEKSSKGFYLSSSHLPQYVKDILEANKKDVNIAKEKIVDYIASFTLSALLLNNIILKISKKMFTMCHIKFLSFNDFNEEYKNTLYNGINKSLTNISTNIAKKDFSSISNLINTSSIQLSFFIKERIINSTDIFLFKIQAKEYKAQGKKYFFWLQKNRPTKRPTHAVYCKRCQQGIPFSFDNLPIENGERVFPRKQYNCKCDAVLDYNEFLRRVKNNV
jgi:hypothetical protein